MIAHVDPMEISKFALFGKQKAVHEVLKSAAPKSVVQSSLDVKLLATVAAGKRSAAVMTVGKSAETLFYLGDPLQDGVFLKSVQTDAVILDHQGKAERIALSDGKTKAGSRAAIAIPASSVPPAATYTDMPPFSPPPTADQQFTEPQSADSGGQMDTYTALLSQAMLMPNVVDGKVDGFMVEGIVSDSVYAKMGLKDGDIIRTVSGQAIGDRDPVMLIQNSIEKTAAISLQVMRGGAVIPVYYAMPN
ncbi:MAG: type II secretion system protein N [Mariprofundaceae bacterium]|nr:type II secretion system protein N [Mariprofundaceae bacterium]